MIAIAFLMTMVLVPYSMIGANVKVVKQPKQNQEELFIRRAPANYSDAAIAYLNTESGILGILFMIEVPSVEIEIYKEGILVITENRSLSIGDNVDFDLSVYGRGEYQFIISNTGEEDLYGSFQY